MQQMNSAFIFGNLNTLVAEDIIDLCFTRTVIILPSDWLVAYQFLFNLLVFISSVL